MVTQQKPVILAVDDEPEVVAAVRRDLRTKYSNDYQVVAAIGGPEAEETLKEMALRSTPVALILTDQRMPGLTGIELLQKTKDLFPDTKRALLTAYADTEVAIQGINEVDLDHYIRKPWDPPEDNLYPIVDDLLDDWAAGYRPVFDGIRVIAPQWSREAHALKAFLARNQVPYQSMDVETDPHARTLVKKAGATEENLPLLLFNEGVPLMKPTTTQIAERIGLSIHATAEVYDVVIVGGGPAGLAAAVYASSEGLATLLVEEDAPGGQAGQSSLIENYLGFPKGLSGADLARRATAQARRLGAEILVPGVVSSISRNDPYRSLQLADGSVITSKAIVVASGVSYRKLNATGLDELIGVGVYYGTSTVEASNHRDQPVYVVGGGNSAGQASLFLSRFTDSITVIIRGPDLSASMSRYLIDNIDANDAISVRPTSQVLAGSGTDRLETLLLQNVETKEEEKVDASAVFIFIGQKAHTDWLAGAVQLDDRGFVLTGTDIGALKGWNVERDPLPLETSVPGIFAAGDVRHGSIKRVAGAVGEGATAIRFVHEHLASL